MPNKLRFYINEKGEKIYTLKEEVKVENKEIKTKDAHYKFLGLGK